MNINYKVAVVALLGSIAVSDAYATFYSGPTYNDEIGSGIFLWKFCNDDIEFDYFIINGTLRETAHLKLHNTHHCEDNTNPTDYQLQLWHTSNNQTDFTIIVPDDLDFEKINVQVVGRGYVELFVLNDTHRSLQFSNFTHDKHGDINIILDFIS